MTRDQAVPLEENENFITDLIHMEVYTDEGIRLGTLTDVLQTGANDVYEVTDERGNTFTSPRTPWVDVMTPTLKVSSMRNSLSCLLRSANLLIC